MIRLASLTIRLTLALILLAPSFSDAEPSLEYKIKAGYLYNFTKFISWPKDGERTFNLCILAADPFGNLIDAIEEHTALNRPIKVFRLGELATDPHCHIVFVKAFGQSLARLRNYQNLYNTLTVSEQPNFAEQGGMIGFVNRNDKIRLQINLNAIRRSGLSVSAKLLEVAEIVKDGGDGD